MMVFIYEGNYSHLESTLPWELYLEFSLVFRILPLSWFIFHLQMLP